METYPNDVRIVFKHNALPFHNRAKFASAAAIAAHKQGKFWEYHDKLFANQRALEDETLKQYATELGLDLAKWEADRTSKEVDAMIEKDMDLAQKVNARGTPNFFVNGRNLRGAVPFENFDDLIKEELEKAKTLVAAGTAAADVYAKTIANGKVFEPLESQVNEFSADNSPFLGNKDGDLVIYEFSDFQ